MDEYLDLRASGKPHSVLGIFSFLVALLASLPGFPCMILTGIMIATWSDTNYPDWLTASVGLALLATLGSLCLIPLSLVLGILSLFERERKRIFAWIGLAQSLMLLCPFIALGLLLLVSRVK